MTIRKSTVLLSCLTGLALAAQTPLACAQSRPPVYLGSSMDDALKHEKERHGDKITELMNREVDAQTDLASDKFRCGSDPSCRKQAQDAYDKKHQAIGSARAQEDGTHVNNLHDIFNYWGKHAGSHIGADGRASLPSDAVRDQPMLAPIPAPMIQRGVLTVRMADGQRLPGRQDPNTGTWFVLINGKWTPAR